MKPKPDHVYSYDLPEEGRKLKGKHPIVITSNNEDDTSNALGCSSKGKLWLPIPDKKVETDIDLPNDTFARMIDGERLVENDKVETFWDKITRKVTNADKLKEGL